MNVLYDPDLRHFVAINHHQYHPSDRVLAAIESTATAVARMGHRSVTVTFCHHETCALEPQIFARLMELGITPVTVPNGSNGNSLNAQLDAARDAGADFFYRVDADDTVAITRFERQAQLLEQGAADVVGGALDYIPIDGRAEFTVLPPKHPGAWGYLTNCAMLHPTLGFRMNALTGANIRYWTKRLDDKQLGLQLRRAGLRILNDPVVYGTYTLNPVSRSSLLAARLNLGLNLRYAITSRRIDLVPVAVAIFAASCLAPSQSLRRLRQILRGAPAVKPAAKFADGSDKAEIALPPRG
jgi:hypothetical protein